VMVALSMRCSDIWSMRLIKTTKPFCQYSWCTGQNLRRAKPHCHCYAVLLNGQYEKVATAKRDTVFFYVTPCGLVCDWRRFGGTYRLRLHCRRFCCSEDGGGKFFVASAGVHGVRHRTAALWLITPVRTSYLPQTAVRRLLYAGPILSLPMLSRKLTAANLRGRNASVGTAALTTMPVFTRLKGLELLGSFWQV
jgi:hypothetical protein